MENLSNTYLNLNGNIDLSFSIYNGYYVDHNDNIKCVINGEELSNVYDNISFLLETKFTTSGFLFLKHGNQSLMIECREHDIKQVRANNVEHLFNFIIVTVDKKVILASSDLLEEINKVVNCTGYINKFIKKYEGLDSIVQFI